MSPIHFCAISISLEYIKIDHKIIDWSKMIRNTLVRSYTQCQIDVSRDAIYCCSSQLRERDEGHDILCSPVIKEDKSS